MSGKKVNLQWITNDSSRRATFNKHCKGLMKKASELATLCGGKACVVVYCENEAQPVVWPSVAEATDILTRFKAMPELGQWKKNTNHEDFLCKRITKVQDQENKSDHKSRELETLFLLHESIVGHRPGLIGVSVEELTSLHWMVERKMKTVKECLQQLGVEQGTLTEPEPLLPQQLPPAPSLLQPLVPYISTEIHGKTPVEEPQAQQPDCLMGVDWDGGELCDMVYSAFAGSSSGVSTSGGRGDMVQPYNLGGSGSPWALDPFPPME